MMDKEGLVLVYMSDGVLEREAKVFDFYFGKSKFKWFYFASKTFVI